jgi:hypothetical protein
MKVLITEVGKIGEENMVAFHSEFGDGKAIWNGETPLTDKEYHVEIEIRGTLLWGRDIIESPDERYKIESGTDGLNLTGKIESIDDDGYTVIRLNGSIVCVETLGVPFLSGAFVRVYASKVELFNQNYN